MRLSVHKKYALLVGTSFAFTGAIEGRMRRDGDEAKSLESEPFEFELNCLRVHQRPSIAVYVSIIYLDSIAARPPR